MGDNIKMNLTFSTLWTTANWLRVGTTGGFDNKTYGFIVT
jgi:hypothetical protein